MTEGDSKSQDLLRHIMSSGSMVEDIERQQRRERPTKPSSAPTLKPLSQNFKSSKNRSPPNKIPENDSDKVSHGAKHDISLYLKVSENTDVGNLEDQVIKKSPNIQEMEGTENLLTPAALQNSFSLGSEVVHYISNVFTHNKVFILYKKKLSKT